MLNEVVSVMLQYLKPFQHVQINDKYKIELLVLDINT